MKKLFYIHDIQDLWLFNSLLKKGDSIVYNKTSNKCTSPHNFLDQLQDFKLISFKGDFNALNALIDNCDQFITKECLPFTHTYLSAFPKIRKRNKNKIISISWNGESLVPAAPYLESVKNNYKLHFCEPSQLNFYKDSGFKNLSTQIPKYYLFNTLTRKKACDVLGLDTAQKYVTFIISSGGGLFSSGLSKDVYSKNNHELVSFIKQYCSHNNIQILLKSKLKHNKNQEGLKGDKSFHGDNVFFHQTLLLLAVSEFSVIFGSSAGIEAQAINAPCVFFLSDELIDINKWNISKSTTLSVFPHTPIKDLKRKTKSFLQKARPPSLPQTFPVHPLLV